MKKVIFTTLAFAVAVLLSPNMAGAAGSKITFKVTEEITSGPGRAAPVAGALVTVDGTQKATTGADGTAALDLAGGAHEFTVVADGYFNVLQKLPVGKAQVDVALREFAPWSSFVINNFESNDPAKNRVKFYPPELAIKRTDPGWFLNCLGEHEGTVLTYGSDNHASFTAGNYLTCDFEGTTIRVFTLRTRNSGMAKISVDGKYAQTVDLWSKKDAGTSDYELAYEKYDLPKGKHTVKLEVLGQKNATATDAKVYFDFLDTSDYPVFPRLGILPTVGVTSNTLKEVSFAHYLKAVGPGGFKSVDETGFVVVDAAQRRAPTVNDIRVKAQLGAEGRFSATVPASTFSQRTKYVVMPYAVVGGIVYYGDEPVFFTPAPEIVLERTLVGMQAGQGTISTREVTLRNPGAYSDLKWKLVGQSKYDGTPATGIISRTFKDGDAAVKDVPLQITALSEGEAVIRCYSASNPDKFADCRITVAKPERNVKIAQTPLMGWSSWSAYGRTITDGLMKEIADGMLKPLPIAGGKSLKDLGYNYLLVDGGWRVNWLAPDGRIVPNSLFGGVEGMKALSKYVHDNGMKFGLHMCPGWGDCAGQPMGADGFQRIHLQEYASWMIDQLFVDICTSEKGRRRDPDPEYVQTIYSTFKYYVDNCGRDMVIKATGVNNKEWGYPLVNYFRVGGDIAQYINTSTEGGGRWLNPLDKAAPKNSAAFIEAKNVANNWRRIGQGTGLWADPDQMVFGDPGLNLTEQQSMFNMWSITGSPLVLGGTISDLTDEKKGIVQIITNTEIIAVDQDALGRVGHVLKAYTNNPGFGVKKPDPATAAERPELNLTVFGRPLADGSWALVIMNNTTQVQNITVKFADMDYDGSIGGNTRLTAGNYYLRNLCTHKDMGKFTDEFSCNDIPVHGSVMIKVTPEKLFKK